MRLIMWTDAAKMIGVRFLTQSETEEIMSIVALQDKNERLYTFWNMANGDINFQMVRKEKIMEIDLPEYLEIF